MWPLISISPTGLRWLSVQRGHLAYRRACEPLTIRHPSTHHDVRCSSGSVGRPPGRSKLSCRWQRGNPRVRVSTQWCLLLHNLENHTQVGRPCQETNADTSLMVVHHREKTASSNDWLNHSASGSGTGSITTSGMLASMACPSSHCTETTVPLTGACISFCIFIASRIKIT